MALHKIKKTPGDTSWFMLDRFGMFIHWGLYSLPARHEWIKNYECIKDEDYNKYFDYFNPDMYDPCEWARAAKKAGMKYVVMTAKHHEGFCLFDSQYTDFKCTNTKYGKDIMKEYVEAFRAEGLRVGFYYSLIDWHHPDFTIDPHHPQRFDKNAEEINKTRDMKVYCKYMRDQVTELLTNYGKIDILWFDFSYSEYTIPENPGLKGKGKDDWEAEKLLATARALQPDIIIDNRTEIDQDIYTPEQYQVTHWPTHKETGELVPWEACHTLCNSWGYFRDERDWKSPDMLIKMLIDTVALGGNFLMNVGPTSRGYLDSHALKALEVYGDWMKYNSRSIYGCTMPEAGLIAPNGVKYTQSEDGKRLYVHFLEYPYRFAELPGLAGRVAYAQFLHDGSEVLFDENKPEYFSESLTEQEGLLILHMPLLKPDVTVPVIELFLK